MLSDYLQWADLIRKSLSEELSAEEQRLLDRWLTIDRNRKLYEAILQEQDFAKVWEESRAFSGYMDFRALESRLSGFPSSDHQRHRFARRRWMMWSLSACAVVALSFSLFLYRKHCVHPPIEHQYSSAVLILGDSAQSVVLSDQAQTLSDGAEVKVAADGRGAVLSYARSAAEKSDSEAMPELNRLVVPRGSDYRLLLADGTEVFLNANSELEYPVTFCGPTREVRLRGMAYFAVARDTLRPFVVHTTRSQVQVLGTEFCVSDYPGSANLTTLVNGRVAVTDTQGGEHALLPGHQAVITDGTCEIREVETMFYTAWKDGFFIFREASLQEIMEELSGWYDIDYLLRGNGLETLRVTARLKRYEDIDRVLDVLSRMEEVRFRKTGRTITVTAVKTP